MPLSEEQLQRLLELCEVARTGDKPWRTGTANVWDETTDECIAVTYRNRLRRSKQLAVAEFIAAFDPSTCADLVREVMRLRERLERRRYTRRAFSVDTSTSAK